MHHVQKITTLVALIILLPLIVLVPTSNTNAAPTVAPNAKAEIVLHPDQFVADVTPYHLGSNIAAWLGGQRHLL